MGRAAGFDGNDYEIYPWRGGIITQITDNSTDDMYTSISGSNLAWQGCEDGYCYGENSEIYMTTSSDPFDYPVSNWTLGQSFDNLYPGRGYHTGLDLGGVLEIRPIGPGRVAAIEPNDVGCRDGIPPRPLWT